MKYILLITVFFYAVSTLAQAVKEDYTAYLASSTCIAKHISYGVERKNIKVIGANCYVRGRMEPRSKG